MSARWQRLVTGIRATVWITCPGCGESSEVSFDYYEMSGTTEVDCPREDCGMPTTVSLEAMVQFATETAEVTP